MSEKRSILQATAVVSATTAVSRVTGFVRDAVVSNYFGTGMFADAFIAAFRIPNILRRLFGEGSLTISFIPIFTEVREHEGPEAARLLFNKALTLLAVVLTGLVTLGMVNARALVAFIAPGFGDQAFKDEVTVLLTRIMLPYAILVCSVALCMGVLNVHRKFFAPAFAPVLLNLSMIISTFALRRFFDWPVVAVAIGVVLGGVLQVTLQIPYLKSIRHIPRPSFRFKDRNLLRIGLLMLPGLIGMSVYTIDVFINSMFASLLEPGAVSFLYYSDRLMELPQGGFAIAVGTALLPSLSMMATKGDRKGMVETMNYAARLVLIIMMPAAVGLLTLAEPICNVLYQRGHFDWASTRQTAIALRYYTLGLVFFGLLRVLVPTFYSMKDTFTPAVVALCALGVNILFGLSSMGPTVSDAVGWIAWYTHHVNPTGPMRHGGLALANSLSAVFNMTVLSIILRRRLGPLGARKILRTLVITGVACVPLALVAHTVASWFSFQGSGFSVDRAGGLALAIALGGAAYFVVLALLDRKQFLDLLARIRRRRGAAPPVENTSAGDGA